MSIKEVDLPSAARPADGPRPVYVIDDDSMVRRALFFALRAAGFEPRSFSSGRDFLDEADELAPGCVLLDLRMPGMDGMSVLEQLGARTQKLPVVIITGHGEVEVAVRAMKRGASDFLEKPFDDAELMGILDELFQRLPMQAEAAVQQVLANRRVAELTARERETLQGLVDGLANKEVARRLAISVRTVEVHRANLMKKLQVGSVAEALQLAMAAGMKPSGT